MTIKARFMRRRTWQSRKGRGQEGEISNARPQEGTLKSGSGRTVKSRKHAIPIGLSEAREKGGKVPKRKTKRAAKKP